MKHIDFTRGRNLYDFFIIPTIRVDKRNGDIRCTIEWLKWYIGIWLWNEDE